MTGLSAYSAEATVHPTDALDASGVIEANATGGPSGFPNAPASRSAIVSDLLAGFALTAAVT